MLSDSEFARRPIPKRDALAADLKKYAAEVLYEAEQEGDDTRRYSRLVGMHNTMVKLAGALELEELRAIAAAAADRESRRSPRRPDNVQPLSQDIFISERKGGARGA